jgi:hypothetical protein
MAIDNNQSGYTPKPSDSNFVNSSSINNSSPVDNIPDIVNQVVDQIFRALQPRVREFALGLASRAVDTSEQSTRQLISRARQKPIYTIGAVALLVVGLGLILGNTQSSSLSPHELH